MTCAATLDLEICKGSTFSKVLRWESGTLVFKAITGITRTAPARVTVPDYRAPDGWRVAITDVVGMTQINAAKNPPTERQFLKSARIDPDTLDLVDINARAFSAYVSGGTLRYHEPVDLTGYAGRMHIRALQSSTTTLLELTTVNLRILLDNTLKTITLIISAVDTAAITFTEGVYDLELVSPGGIVTRLLEGAVSVVEEVTR